jgi:hypothetical protein
LVLLPINKRVQLQARRRRIPWLALFLPDNVPSDVSSTAIASASVSDALKRASGPIDIKAIDEQPPKNKDFVKFLKAWCGSILTQMPKKRAIEALKISGENERSNSWKLSQKKQVNTKACILLKMDTPSSASFSFLEES